ncbi:MAG: DUF4835 family protein [Calditrichaeota bacterium]|nr:DUF4835 family protein [Calditrichota bacterium]RQW07918.1 MAG: DUF4835 family protein [Calditrichota bacterium]
MAKKHNLIILTTLFLSLYISSLTAQRMNCTVKLDMMPAVQPQDQQELTDFGSKLMDYINNKRWSDENLDIILPCNISIIIQTVNYRGSEKTYLAQFLISSPSGENFYDQGWEFTYIPGQSFEPFRTSFDPLLDLIDFYVYMVMAGEMDTFELFAGSAFYDRCQEIANRGQLSNYASGWKSRLEEVILITDGDHGPLREAKFYYYEGLFFVEKRVNPENARKFADAVIKRLQQVHSKRPNSKALKRFFDSHYQEICKLLQFDEDRSNINTLIDINATHIETYRECEIGKSVSR